MNNELGYLAENMLKQSVEGCGLASCCSRSPRGDTDTLRKEPSNKNEPGLGDVGEFAAYLDGK